MPIGKWTSDYKEYLETLIDKGVLKKVINNSTEASVHFIITPSGNQEIDLKLTSTLNTSNMHLFDETGQIRKFESTNEIIERFVKLRLHMYKQRKNHLLELWNNECHKLQEMIKFMELVMDDEVIIFKRKKQNIIDQMITQNLDSKLFEEFLNIKIQAFSYENIQKKTNQLAEIKQRIKDLSNQTPKDIWMTEI